MNYQHRTCPACGHNSASNLEVRAAQPTENMSFEQAAEFWRGFREESCFFSYARCRGCGLLYCPQYFTGDQLDELYRSMPDNTDGVQTEVLDRTHAGYAKEIRARGASGGTFLELGPDIGLTLTQVLRNAPFSAVAAVEPNLEVHDQLRSIDPRVSVWADLSDLPATDQFDQIVAIHVLDHVLDIQGLLGTLEKRSNPGASLALVVHNEGSLLRKMMGKKWPPFCLQHPQLFSGRTLSQILSRAGWDNVQVTRTVNWFPVKHLARGISDITPIPGSVVDYAPSTSVPMVLGNMLVTAQR